MQGERSSEETIGVRLSKPGKEKIRTEGVSKMSGDNFGKVFFFLPGRDTSKSNMIINDKYRRFLQTGS